MKIKRFTARDMPTATHLIKEEFGLAAMILSQRVLPPEEGGGVEVTAGVKDEDLPKSVTPPRPKTGQALGVAAYQQAERNFDLFPEEEDRPSDLNTHFEHLGRSLRQEIGELKTLILDLAHRQSLAEKWRDRPDLVSLYRQLVDTGLTPEATRSLVEVAAESAVAWGGEPSEHLRRSLRPKLRLVDLSLCPPKVLALVGPSGGGKTTALVNLATFYRQRGLKVAAITLDTLRLGGAEQLTLYARILGLGVRVCQSHDEFKEALELFESEDVILVDTPGRSFQKSESRLEMGIYLKEARASALLVLPAGFKEEDLNSALTKGRSLAEAGLVFTKFDETESLGALVGFLIAQAPRLAFFSLGPKTSEDFIMASPDKLLDLWLGPASEAQSDSTGN